MGNSINSLMGMLELTDALNISESCGKRSHSTPELWQLEKKDQEKVLLA